MYKVEFKRVRRDSNPRPAALETAALPAELHTLCRGGAYTHPIRSYELIASNQLTIRG